MTQTQTPPRRWWFLGWNGSRGEFLPYRKFPASTLEFATSLGVVIRQGARRRVSKDEKETGRTREKERDTDGKKSRGKEGGVDAGRYHRSTAYRNSVCAARRRRWRPRPPPTGCYFACLFVPSASERLNLLPKRGKGRGDREPDRIPKCQIARGRECEHVSFIVMDKCR